MSHQESKGFCHLIVKKTNIIELWRSILPAEATKEPTEELEEEVLLHHILTLYATV